MADASRVEAALFPACRSLATPIVPLKAQAARHYNRESASAMTGFSEELVGAELQQHRREQKTDEYSSRYEEQLAWVGTTIVI
jgi:hypothetical protein